MGLLSIPLLLLIIIVVITAQSAKGDKWRTLKIVVLVLLGLLVVSAGICVLILSNMKGNFH